MRFENEVTVIAGRPNLPFGVPRPAGAVVISLRGGHRILHQNLCVVAASSEQSIVDKTRNADLRVLHIDGRGPYMHFCDGEEHRARTALKQATTRGDGFASS